MPKHRRSEIEPSRASVWAPANTAESWPEAVGYGRVEASAGPATMDAEVWHEANGYPASYGYDGYGGYDRPSAEPGWAVAVEGHSWEQWAVWEDGAAPPVMDPDHLSAPMPRVDFPPDHPSRPMSAYRSGPHDRPPARPGPLARTRSAPPGAGYHDGSRRLHAVPDDPAPEGPDWRGGPATGRFRNGRYAGRHSQWMAGHVHMAPADITQEAQDYGASIRETAEREAAAITQQAAIQAEAIREAAEREAVTTREAAAREAISTREAAEREAAAITQQAASRAEAIRGTAERETAELLAQRDSMTGELGRLAAYITESLATPGMPMTAPAFPEATPAPPRTRPALPDSTPAGPDSRPAGPVITPARPVTTPTRPGTRPAGPTKPRATPAKKSQQQGRQKQAMRIATAATVALALIAVGTGAAELSSRGFQFFVFRQAGTGQTAGNTTDHQFLAQQAAAAHHHVAPKGRHHKKSHQTSG